MPQFYDCYHERCDSVKKGGDQRFTSANVLVGCVSGHFETGFKKLVRCHCGFAQCYYCPTCKTRIDLEVAGAPALPVVGARRAGKSVFLASLAAELQQYEIKNRLGIQAQVVEDYREYRMKVVNPLLHRGELPRRTPVGDHSSLVVKLDGRDWSTHVARFSDAAGEVWMNDLPPAPDAKDELERVTARQQATLDRAERVLFVADPERDDELKGRMRHNIIEDIEILLKAADGLSGTKTAVEERFRRLDDELTASSVAYPHRLPDRAEIDAIFIRLGLSKHLDEVNRALDRTWDEYNCRPSAQYDLERYVQYIEQQQRQHRLAIVISKSDALGDRFRDYQKRLAEILKKEKLRDERGWLASAGSAAGWRGAMKRIVALGRELAPEALARYLEARRKTIPEAAFFFVSALGGRTEPVLVGKHTAEPGARATGIHAFGQSESPPAPAPTPIAVPSAGQSLTSWRVDGLRLANGPHSRKPAPENIWLPLLWVLGGRSQ